MTTLTAKARDSVEILLNTYSALCQAESRVGKRGHEFGLTVTNDSNNADFVSVSVSNKIAKTAIAEQKAGVAKELARHGIKVA